jgi:Tfp pilus assembly protein PilZ
MNQFGGRYKNTKITDQLIELINRMPEKKQRQLLKLLLKSMSKEHRQHLRKPCMISVDYSNQDRVYQDFIQNMSTSGLFIGTRESFGVGEEISMAFSIPDAKDAFKLTGKVVRSGLHGFGLKFKAMDPSQKKDLQSFVAQI